MLGIADYLWRLIPANPILLRVVQIGGKRRRDLLIRCGYLGFLIVLVLILLVQQSSDVGGDLDKLTDISRSIFQQMSYGQLLLVALLAPMFTAGAITQEKDSQTYDVLLATPLSNGQIILGSLLSRLFFIIALLVSGIPIFSITQIFGGVAIGSIALSFAIAAATAFITGALAMAIATFKVGTRRTIFSFYLFIVVYLVSLLLLDRLDYFHPVKANGSLALTSWFTGLHPFLALRVIFNDKAYLAPAMAELPPGLQTWPIGWYLSSPHTFFISFMFFLSLLIVVPSIVLLRRAAQSTLSARAWLLQMLHIARGGRRRKPRTVWHNPIAWREARTKASAARAYILRYGFMGAGTIAAFILLLLYSSLQQPASFIDANSIDAAQCTISVITGDRANTYSFDPRATPITLNGSESSVEALQHAKYAVNITTNNRSTLTSLSATDIPRQLSAPDARKFLLGALIVQVAVILLIVTNAAASTVTREKEDGTLDLLLSTPITSHYYIWGKLRGLVSFVLPLIAVPVASILLFVICDGFGQMLWPQVTFRWVVLPEAVLIMPAILIVMAALAAIVGMHMSLRCRTTVMAVMSSIGIVVGASGVLGGCGYALLGRGGSLPQLALASFSPVTVLTVLVDPYTFASEVFDPAHGSDVVLARCLLCFFSCAATAAYATIVWAMYRSMVRNFDMTIRRQSR